MTAAVDLHALGTGVRVVVGSAGGLAAARAAVERVLAAVDLACSRFRPDSELMRLARGRPEPVSPLLASLVVAALDAARATGGMVDPTVGAAMRRIGYDRDFAQVSSGVVPGPPVPLGPLPVPGWRSISLERSLLTVPAGVELDLGATAKAFAADLAARSAAAAAGCGVLASLGGDIAVAGPPPPGGWRVLVTDDHAGPADGPGQAVVLQRGGLATSSTTVRRWRGAAGELHHIVDPATGLPVGPYWRTASVAAATCLEANTAATAAIVWAARAPAELSSRHLPARLVSVDGRIQLVGGWPAAAE